MQWVGEHRGIALADYRQVWRWSVEDVSGFWDAVREYFGVIGTGFNGPALAVERMPGAIWYPNARMNFAENMLRHALTPHAPTRSRYVRSPKTTVCDL